MGVVLFASIMGKANRTPLVAVLPFVVSACSTPPAKEANLPSARHGVAIWAPARSHELVPVARSVHAPVSRSAPGPGGAHDPRHRWRACCSVDVMIRSVWLGAAAMAASGCGSSTPNGPIEPGVPPAVTSSPERAPVAMSNPSWPALASELRRVPVDASSPIAALGPIDAGSSMMAEAGSAPSTDAGWWRTYAGADTSARDSAVDVAVDAHGRAIVLASLAQSAFGLLTYNPDGTLAWASTYRDPSDDADVATKLAVDATGNVYAGGTWQRSGSSLGGGLLVVSFDDCGALRWSARSDPGGVLSDIAVDSAGHVVVTGNGSDGTHSLARTISYDAASGNVAWQVSDAGPLGLGATGRHVALDASSNAYVAGESSDGNQNQVTLFAYDTQGTRLWTTRSADDPVHIPQTTVQALALDALGEPHVAIAEAYRTTKDAEPTVALVVTKYDVSGRVVWAATINEASRNIATAMAVGPQGRVTVTGFAGNPDPDSYLTAQFDSAGQLGWKERYAWAAAGQHQARAVVLDPAGNAYITGTAYRADGMAMFGSIEYNVDGGALFREADGDGDSRVASALALDRSGGLYVAGSVLSAPRGVAGVLRSSH